MPELKDQVEQFASSFAEFKSATEARIEAVEEKGYAPAELEEKVSTMGESLAKQSEALDEMKSAMAKQPKVDLSAKGTPQCLVDYKSAVNGVLRGEEGAELKAHACIAEVKRAMQEDAGLFAEYKTLFVGSDVDGGFGVGCEEGGMIDPIITELSNARQYANVRSGSKPELRYIVNKKGADGAFKRSELAKYVQTMTPQLGEQIIPAHEHYAMTAISEQMLEDSDFDVLGWNNQEVAERFAIYDDNQFFNGTGAGEGRGILGQATRAAGAGNEYGKVDLFNSGGATSFVAENLIGMSGGLKRPYYSGKCNWFVNRQTFFSKLATLKNGHDDFRLITNDFTNGVSFKILGFDVAFAPDMPLGDTEDNIGLAFGNFNKAVTIYDRLGITTKRFEEHDSPLTFFRTRRRSGCDVTSTEAYSLMQMKA